MVSLALRCGKAYLNAGEEEVILDHLDRTDAASSFLRPINRRSKQTVRAALISNANANATKIRRPVPVLLGSMQETFKTSTRRRENKGTDDDDEPINPQKLDDWITESITEIVRNIEEAPFLVHIYSNKDKGSSTRLEREIATAENWPHITRRWNKDGNNHAPDGVILVEQLNHHDQQEEEEEETRATMDEEEEEEDSSNCSSSSCSRLWGIVIQGRGIDRTACYILKTSRVSSSLGFCTHFCLVRAKCFGKAADLQLRDSWLLSQ